MIQQKIRIDKTNNVTLEKVSFKYYKIMTI